MIDLSEYHVSIKQVFQVEPDRKAEAEQRGAHMLRHKLADTLIEKHKTYEKSPGMMAVQISGFFFTEEQMRDFMQEISMRLIP